MMSDNLGRTPIADAVKRDIVKAFALVPDGKRGALLIVGTQDGATAHLAARINENWRVAGGVGVPWIAPKQTTFFVAVEGSW